VLSLNPSSHFQEDVVFTLATPMETNMQFGQM
jgi:hypothetical protein